MRSCILMGGPRREGNTAALLAPFLEECEALGVETKTVWLYDEDIAPCQGCMGCQDRLDGPGCVQEDGFAEIFQAMAASDVIVLATPIYAFFCTAPMKALLDRAIYAGTKNYGWVKGPKPVHLRLPPGEGGRPVGGGGQAFLPPRRAGVSGDVLPPGPGRPGALSG